MNNSLLLIKIKQRLNKLSSFDFDNIEMWMVSEAVNKAQRNWTRRQIQGVNQVKAGAEQTVRKIDDLQLLITPWSATFVDKGLYYESCFFPDDYLDFIRVSCYGASTCCPPRKFKVYQAEMANVDDLLANQVKRPDFAFAETFCTISGNKIQIYTNGLFTIVDPQLVYFRQPRDIQIAGTIDPATGATVTTNVTCEFANDITELIIAEAAEILSADIESPQAARNTVDIDKNT